MKWIKLLTAASAAVIVSTAVFAQDQKEKFEKNKDDKSEEIIIRKKDGKTDKMTIIVDGDNITINGKPIDEFKNDDVTIFRRDRPIAMASPDLRRLNRIHPLNGEDFNYMMPGTNNKAMLGVMTRKEDDGVKVTDVTKESGAEKAGLKKDDIITSVGNTTVNSPEDLVEVIGKYKPNDKVNITFKRDGKENKTTATLGENKSRPYAFNLNNGDFNFDFPKGSPDFRNFNFDWNSKPRIGLQIQDIEEGKGVKVKDVDEDSPALKAGIKEGDIITQVNGKDIADVDELRTALKDLKEGDTVKFDFKRNGKDQTTQIKIPKRLKSSDL